MSIPQAFLWHFGMPVAVLVALLNTTPPFSTCVRRNPHFHPVIVNNIFWKMFVIVYIDLTFNFDSHSRNYCITYFEFLNTHLHTLTKFCFRHNHVLKYQPVQSK